MDLAGSEFGQGAHAGLGGLELAAEAESGVRGERGGAEGRHEDVARLCGGIGEDAVRTLDQPGPEAAREEGFPDLLAVELGNILDTEIYALLLHVGLHEDGEQLALFASDDLPDRAADGRGQEDVSVLFVRHDGGAAEHAVALLDQKSGKETFEISGLYCYDARRYRL